MRCLGKQHLQIRLKFSPAQAIRNQLDESSIHYITRATDLREIGRKEIPRNRFEMLIQASQGLFTGSRRNQSGSDRSPTLTNSGTRPDTEEEPGGRSVWAPCGISWVQPRRRGWISTSRRKASWGLYVCSISKQSFKFTAFPQAGLHQCMPDGSEFFALAPAVGKNSRYSNQSERINSQNSGGTLQHGKCLLYTIYCSSRSGPSIFLSKILQRL